MQWHHEDASRKTEHVGKPRVQMSSISGKYFTKKEMGKGSSVFDPDRVTRVIIYLPSINNQKTEEKYTKELFPDIKQQPPQD